MKVFKNLALALLLLIFTVGMAQAQSKTVKTITVGQFEKLKSTDKDVVILDVRTPAEIVEGKIKNAITIDYMDKSFQSKMEKLDRNKTYVVYCKVGGRSSQAAAKMNAAGFKTTYSLTGGIDAWVAQGKPIEK